MEKIISTIIGSFSLDLHEQLKDITSEKFQKHSLQKDVESILAVQSEKIFEKNKTLISVCGIPASGKSYYVKGLMKASHKNYYYLSFDSIMENLSLYKAKANNLVAAFDECEKIAMIIGYYVLIKCVKEGLSIIFEHSNALEQHVALYQTMQYIYGYTIKIHYIHSTPETSLSRLAKRDRHCPQEYVQMRHNKLIELLPIYKDIADEFIEVHNAKCF